MEGGERAGAPGRGYRLNIDIIIRNYVKDTDNTIFHPGLMLHELVERLTASEFYEYEIETLEELIIKYLDERKEVFSKFPNLLGSAKP